MFRDSYFVFESAYKILINYKQLIKETGNGPRRQQPDKKNKQRPTKGGFQLAPKQLYCKKKVQRNKRHTKLRKKLTRI